MSDDNRLSREAAEIATEFTNLYCGGSEAIRDSLEARLLGLLAMADRDARIIRLQVERELLWAIPVIGSYAFIEERLVNVNAALAELGVGVNK